MFRYRSAWNNLFRVRVLSLMKSLTQHKNELREKVVEKGFTRTDNA